LIEASDLTRSILDVVIDEMERTPAHKLDPNPVLNALECAMANAIGAFVSSPAERAVVAARVARQLTERFTGALQ